SLVPLVPWFGGRPEGRVAGSMVRGEAGRAGWLVPWFWGAAGSGGPSVMMRADGPDYPDHDRERASDPALRLAAQALGGEDLEPGEAHRRALRPDHPRLRRCTPGVQLG